MANPFPFTAGQVLTAAQMNGIGEYAAYTPTILNFTLGNGTLAFRFGRVQNFIHVEGKITLGSTSAVTGAIQISYPVARATPIGTPVGQTIFAEAGVGNRFGTLDAQSTEVFVLAYNVSGGTYVTSSGTTATVPFTWGTGDELRVSFIYEAA